ncbi:nuclear transport factor 2 family protein [Parafrankia elaeagni]|uniref:nuclear transport factor 2 family protein n=1 Tax=Parafrankia elaeagni TaxID=222534 RepID=UPI000A0326B2|nr:nuclear transport factor 2 family protein [Parafrankia elaeagni]
MDYDGYIKTYNEGDDVVTAQQYYTEDITLTMPLGTLSGRDEVIGFLTRGHAGIPEELKPRIVLRSEDHILAELDIVLRPERDVPDHFLTPLVTGQEATARFFASYDLRGDRIAAFRLAWWPPA